LHTIFCGNVSLPGFSPCDLFSRDAADAPAIRA
jgi:hypothetical protein